jgi:uncharacterized protein (DUF1015 family)
VPGFEPFRGVRYVTGFGGHATMGWSGPIDHDVVCAPPYDVIDEGERQALARRHPRNAVRLILPQDHHIEGDRYASAYDDYCLWHSEGTLDVDAAPRFYGYRMEFRDSLGDNRRTVGVIGALELPAAPGEGDILPHERTMAKAKSDRLQLLRHTHLNVDPIWGLTLASGLTDLIEGAAGASLGGCVDDNDNAHTLFAIDDADAIAAIRGAIAGSPLVLADGHHRFETACAFRDQGPENANGARPLGAPAIMTLVVELAEEQLSIQAIHRLVTLTPGFEARASLADAFSLSPVDSLAAAGDDALVLVERGALHVLEPRADVVARELADEPDMLRAVDAAIVERVVAPRWPDATWTFRHDADEIVAQVHNGAYDAGLVLRPPTVATTRAAAAARVRMPQKTTFFYPKPRTGLVFRDLEIG